MMHFAARVQISGLNRQLTLRSLLLVRMGVPIILYFFVSVSNDLSRMDGKKILDTARIQLFFSLLSLAFQAPFHRTFGGWGFVIYWMMNWMGMLAL